jgi:thioredoxin reductase
MRESSYDAVVIGGGAAGLAAALEIAEKGLSVAVMEREDHLGGILMQCVHAGFGLEEFGEELTGPEYAERFIEKVAVAGPKIHTGTTVAELNGGPDLKELTCYSSAHGVMLVRTKAVVLAMGCRERNRGNIRIPGTRPAGIFTAGLAQRLVNIDGYVPGREIAVIGSGDIGLIMARRMTWIGCAVRGVVEILPYPSGLTRNIVQCLEDNGIPLHLSCLTTGIFGRDRVEGIAVAPIENGAVMRGKTFRIPCDTVLLSVGLIPENELSKKAGIELNPMTGGAVVDSTLMTNLPGIFACGNALHVHDLVDHVTEEARRAGTHVAEYLRNERPKRQYRIKAGANVKYVSPSQLDPGTENALYLRALVVKNDARIEIRLDSELVKSVRESHVQPSEMIRLVIGPGELGKAPASADPVMEVSIR